MAPPREVRLPEKPAGAPPARWVGIGPPLLAGGGDSATLARRLWREPIYDSRCADFAYRGERSRLCAHGRSAEMLAFAARTVVSAAGTPAWWALDAAGGGPDQPCSCARMRKQAHRLSRQHDQEAAVQPGRQLLVWGR